MQVISQVRLSTFDGGKSFNGEIRIGDTHVRLQKDAMKTLLSAHKVLGGTVRKFPTRAVVVKNERAATKYGRKVGDSISVTDFATQTLKFDITVGDGIAVDPKNIALVNEFSVSAGDIDLGEVIEVTTKPANTVASIASAIAPGEADDL